MAEKQAVSHKSPAPTAHLPPVTARTIFFQMLRGLGKALILVLVVFWTLRTYLDVIVAFEQIATGTDYVMVTINDLFKPAPLPSVEPVTQVIEGLSELPDDLQAGLHPMPLGKKVVAEVLSLEELRDMVAGTKGFLVRDYNLELGWNNMRYIIENALVQAQLLNRTLVLPSLICARTCAYDEAICSHYGMQILKHDDFGPPVFNKTAWVIPITVFTNVTHLRQNHPVILMSDYLRLHNIPDNIWTTGSWKRSEYHQSPNHFTNKRPELFVAENDWFDPPGVNRVDFFTEEMKARGNWTEGTSFDQDGQRGAWGSHEVTEIGRLLQQALPEDPFTQVIPWIDAIKIVQAGLEREGLTIQEVEDALNDNGWEVLHTYDNESGFDHAKHVARPNRQVAPRQSLRSFKDDYDHVDAEVLLLEGDVSIHRKPGSFRFTTAESRDAFSDIVLYQMRALDVVYDLAYRLDERILAINNGKKWMGAHMRRDDYVRHGWVQDKDIADHLQRVKRGLTIGRGLLILMAQSDAVKVPTGELFRDSECGITELIQLPEENDRFFIATDESDIMSLNHLIQNGALLARQLLLAEDRRDFGWPLLFSDVMGLVEQATLARSTFFYGHGISSLAGGVVNMRAARGCHVATNMLEHDEESTKPQYHADKKD